MINEVIEKLQSIHEELGLTAPRGAVRAIPTLPAALVLPSSAETGWAASGTLRRITRLFTVWLITAPSTDDESHFAETADWLDVLITSYPPVCDEWVAIKIADEGVTANIRLYDLSNQPHWGAKINLEITSKFGG